MTCFFSVSRHEAKFIKGIIKDVLNKLRRECLYVPEHLVGMDLDHDISDFLSTATDDVRIVSIHGMPGIGKTTIAKVVFNQLDLLSIPGKLFSFGYQ
jgi:MoxR-like ATPase